MDTHTKTYSKKKEGLDMNKFDDFEDKFAQDETTGSYLLKSDYIDSNTGFKRGYQRRDVELTKREDWLSVKPRGLSKEVWDSDAMTYAPEREQERMLKSVKVRRIV
jgi:hypothetical protein